LGAHQTCADDEDLHGRPASTDRSYSPTDLDSRVAIVTGAGSGIGAAVAHDLASRGMTVALAARRGEALEQVAAEITAAAGRAVVFPTDLAVPGAPAALVEAVAESTGRLDVVVNNAAFFRLMLVEDVTEAVFDEHVAVNLRAPYFLVQAALPRLKVSPAPVVVNVSSAAAAMYRSRQSVYGLTKAGLEHMTKNLAAELAPHGIRVNAVRPGPVDTPFHRQAVADPEARIAELGRMVPLGRVGRPDEIARWVGYLVDPAAEWVTGSVVVVDGGRVLGPPES
jgi:3-oxoacyl-[acyl-carrier protein] reductase